MISPSLSPESIGGAAAGTLAPKYRILVVPEIDSTNTELKQRLREDPTLCEGLVLFAKQQSAGRGRLGRTFYSPPGSGLYFSLLLRPKKNTDVLGITSFAAVAVVRAISAVCGLDCQIKWVNDIFLCGKKICGILAEGIPDSESGRISAVILGIGINVKKTAFPPELKEIADSLEGAGVTEVPLPLLAAALLKELEPLLSGELPGGYMEEYRKKNLIPGNEILVKRGELCYPAFAESIADDGALLVRLPDGTPERLNTGEVSVRIRNTANDLPRKEGL